MSDITIDELPVPASLEDPAFAHFARFIDVSNANREHIFGTSLRNLVAPEMVAQLQDQTYFQQRLFVARIDDQIVANAMVGNMGQERSHLAWLGVTVHPDHRRQGIGTTLAGHVEAVAREIGSTTFQASVFHTSTPGGPRLASPTGHGDLPASDPGVRFLQRRGYHLEQIGRLSVLDLPVDPTVLTERWSPATAAAGADYRVVTWEGPTPDERLDDIALLNFRMFTDAPPANMEYDTTPWDAARVRAEDAAAARSGRLLLTTAVEHRPTGRLVAFSQLRIPQDRARPVTQEATLVLKEHRGHRLGMLVKIANIQELSRVSPQSPVIETSNAEENRPMLAVNEAIGFRAIGYSGMWKKIL